MTLYDDLGVDKHASHDQIKRAYRSGAQKHHPDKGGDPATFHALQAAYDVLGDEERRKRYDETGSTGRPPDPLEQARTLAAQAFAAAVLQNDVERENIIEGLRRGAKDEQAKFHRQIKEHNRTIAKLESARGRLQRKRGLEGENVLAMAIDAQIANLRRDIKEAERMRALGDVILGVLDEYDYRVDKGRVVYPTSSSTASTQFQW